MSNECSNIFKKIVTWRMNIQHFFLKFPPLHLHCTACHYVFLLLKMVNGLEKAQLWAISFEWMVFKDVVVFSSLVFAFSRTIITLGYFHNLGQCDEPYGGTIISMNKHHHHTTTSGLTRTKSSLKQYDNKSMVMALVLVN